MRPLRRVGTDPVPRPPHDHPHDDPHATPSVHPEVRGALALEPSPLVWGPPGAVPDERRLRLLGQALAEVLTGRRPPETVAERLTDQAYRELVRAGRMIKATRPPFAGVPHVKEPRDGAVEMCLLVHCGERSHVLALRLERRGIQWLVTDFETA
ncbi:Rv3235 family protein [Nonomuraea lactucae]|uniref:Rv3235 family protein n=1 Tax=Nonomuraea lactucae TaxID=2249762 RepID=UPI000DE38DD6|nr:Rv3235 family protein [Nonomuraea lactucae]